MSKEQKITEVNNWAEQRIRDKQDYGGISLNDFERIERDRLSQVYEVEHPIRAFLWSLVRHNKWCTCGKCVPCRLYMSGGFE